MSPEESSSELVGDIDVSIIVPYHSFDSMEYETCLDSLRVQDYPGGYEVLLVKGGNIPQARNHGLLHAGGRLVAFIDSDCIAPTNWLSVASGRLLEMGDIGGVGGSGVSPPDSNRLSQAIDHVYQTKVGSLGSPSLSNVKAVEERKSLSTHNSIFYKGALTDVGGFDERYLMNEDTELCNRLHKRGYALFFVPESFVYHNRKASFGDFFHKFFSYGVSRTRATLTDSGLFDVRVYGLLVSITMCLLAGFWYLFFPLIVFLLYISLVLFLGVNVAVRERDGFFLFIIPLLFFLQHTGYALGLFWGFTKGRYRSPDRGGVFKLITEVFNR